MAPEENKDYYNVCDNFPILDSVFNAGFYGCKKECVRAQLDVLSALHKCVENSCEKQCSKKRLDRLGIFHECYGRDYCGRRRILERLPRRKRKWEIDNAYGSEIAWGLNAVFCVSFFKVCLYHLLILAGPLIFWGFWLQRWPKDWQNASIPFFAVVVLLSLFWLPFAHKTKIRRKDKGKVKTL